MDENVITPIEEARQELVRLEHICGTNEYRRAVKDLRHRRSFYRYLIASGDEDMCLFSSASADIFRAEERLEKILSSSLFEDELLHYNKQGELDEFPLLREHVSYCWG